MKKTSYLIMMVFFTLLTLSCKEDEKMNPTASFMVTIQNVSEGKDYFNAGASDAIPPGGSYSFSFQAGKGHYLSFATMFVQSNDLFYAPDENGIALYNDSGDPVTGNVTSMVYLWDAGTEVNQEPGVGTDQAPRQASPDTGMDENGNVVLITDVNDGFVYPSNDEVISVILEHDGGTMFTATIYNVSDAGSFQTPLAPGSWVVHGTDQPIFTMGNAASGGLEDLAEDGVNSTLSDDYIQNSGFVSPFAPGVWAVHSMTNPVYTIGLIASAELEALAEDGDPSGFVNSLNGVDGVKSFDVFTTPMGSGSPAPIFPNEQYSFEFEAQPGDKLTFATMLVQSNDLFVGAEIDLFQNGPAVSGDITSQFMLFDAMTEKNEFPGAGNYQAPRQTGPDSGESESGMVDLVNDNFVYPAVSDMLKISISSNQY
jgi:hypothetical protein